MVVAVDDVIRIASEGALGAAAQANVNVFHYQASTVVDDDPATVTAELKAAIESFWDDVLSILHTSWTMTNLSFENVTQDVLYDDLAISKTGTASDDALPSQVAALIIGRTSKTRVQGRKYLGGITEAGSANAGQWSTAVLTALGNAKDSYKVQINGASGNVYDPGVFNAVDVVPFNGFIGGAAIQFARTQRSRTQVLGFA